LIADFGFKTAVTAFDVATIQPALENNSVRIGAEIMLLADLDGELIAASSNKPVAHTGFPPQILLSESNQSINAPSSIAMIDGQIFQLVNLPVKAPVTVARAVSGQSVDQAFAFNKVHEYLSLKTSLTATADYQVDAILFASLDEAYARYAMLKEQILVIAGITLFLSLLATIMISRNITRPIANLVA
jgi:hypothetical protein